MDSEEDFVFRPVIAGMCKYESLKDGTLTLLDVTKMNEALDVKSENEYRIRNAK
jgi:hypothetical protein